MATSALASERTDVMLTTKDVAEILSIGKRTLWRWVANGTFPKPILINARTARWLATTVQNHLDRWKEGVPQPQD